jgi:hypothetical protein
MDEFIHINNPIHSSPFNQNPIPFTPERNPAKNKHLLAEFHTLLLEIRPIISPPVLQRANVFLPDLYTFLVVQECQERKKAG